MEEKQFNAIINYIDSNENLDCDKFCLDGTQVIFDIDDFTSDEFISTIYRNSQKIKSIKFHYYGFFNPKDK